MKKSLLCLFAVLVIAIAAMSINAQWSQVNLAATNNTQSVGAIAANDTVLVVGTWNRGIYRSLDSAKTWTAANVGLSNTTIRGFCRSTQYPKVIFGATDSFGVIVTSNYAASWTHLDTGLTNKHVYAVAFIAGQYLMAGTLGSGVFRSGDGGGHWESVVNGMADLNVRCFTTSGPNLYAGTNSGGVFRTTNRGDGWSTVSTNNGNDVYAIAAYGRYLLAGTYGGGLLRTADTGRNWSAINSGILNLHVRALVASGRSLFAGTDSGGVYLSTDTGATWTAVGAGLPADKNVTALSVYGATLLVGTAGSGLWKRPLSEVIAVETPGAGAQPGFRLEQNQPNPFSPSTVVSFRISTRTFVHVGVYDVNGKLVSIVVNELKAPGLYQSVWNPSNSKGKALNPGVYILRMKAAAYSASRKMMLLR